MAGYNLDDGKSLFEFFSQIHATKVLSLGQRLSVKHYSTFEFSSAVVIDVSDKSIRIKYKTSLPELDFSPRDPVVMEFNDEDKVYFMYGEIETIDSLDPLSMTIKVLQVDKKESLRKAERFAVSLASSIETIDGKTIFSIVKNLSLHGVKVNCKENLSIDEVVKLSIVIDKYYSLECKGKVVRKNKSSNQYEYGFEIVGMSSANSIAFKNYIAQLKSSF